MDVACYDGTSLHARRRSTSRPHVVALAFSVATLVAIGCGTSRHPPALGDDPAPPVDASTGFDFDSPPPELSCNLGPEGGVCACADEALDANAPNLYFVLDRSGSMSELWGGTSDKWQVVINAIARLVVGLGPRAKIGAAVFPDPGSANACGPGVEALAPREGDSPAGRAGPTAIALLTVLGQISANGGTPTAATLQAPWLTQELSSLSAKSKTYVILATDGGPNCNASATCGTDRDGVQACQPNIESVANCPPGGPNNCCTGPSGALSCEDSAPTIAAVTALAAAGTPVYVIGVPGSTPYANLLDQLAIAGGTDRGQEPHYYAADTADQSQFVTAISRIAAKLAGGCTVQLDNPPPDPTHVNVFLGGQVLPQTGADGWTLDGSTVTILGASCQSILDGDVIDVRVVGGCPTVLI
ncbi:MAG TPA: vWA domain-containing protein [Polyangiaceae bacterium]|nr:vWA domain-containing protein [Polyangiaceae bacterium]